MSMNLLIVDDEYEILTWLQEMFEYDFEPAVEVYTASSADEALQLLNKISFNVVLTDIKMPGMDGLTLFTHIKENWPRCKTVFLTGYPNFDDMYKIIRHKDVRYILKSEDDETIMRAVKEMLDEQKEEFEREVERQKQIQDVEKARDLIRQNFICSMLRGLPENPDLTDISARVSEAGLTVDPALPFLMFTVRIDNGDEVIRNPVDQTLLLEAAGSSIYSALPLSLRSNMCVTENRWYTGFVQEDGGQNDMSRLFAVTSSAVEYAQRLFEQMEGVSFSAAIESTPLLYADLPQMFLRMRQILQGRLGTEKSVIAHLETLNPDTAREAHNTVCGNTDILRSHLEMHRRREYFTLLEGFCAEMMKCTTLRDSYGSGLYYGISVLLLQFIGENRIESRLPAGTQMYKLTQLDAHASWDEAIQYLYDVSSAVFDALSVPDNDLSESALRRIIDYIEHNPEKDLSLTRLADIGGFNASYLSRLFKQNFNITISDYVTEKRMKLAAVLLKTTNDKIQDIAEKTGYLSSQSFARAFRGYFSVSAAEYREINKGNFGQ